MLYLGIFIILSPAFDDRFYPNDKKLPTSLSEEMEHAALHFNSLLHVFSSLFVLLLEGEPVAVHYVVDRMLGEFAAAAVGLGKGVLTSEVGEDGITFPRFLGQVEDAVKRSHPNAFPYYSRCLDRGHKHFIWTGPKVQIVPRSDDIISVLQIATWEEKADHPSHQIYEDVGVSPPTLPASMSQPGKRRKRGGSMDLRDGQSKRKKR